MTVGRIPVSSCPLVGFCSFGASTLSLSDSKPRIFGCPRATLAACGSDMPGSLFLLFDRVSPFVGVFVAGACLVSSPVTVSAVFDVVELCLDLWTRVGVGVGVVGLLTRLFLAFKAF